MSLVNCIASPERFVMAADTAFAVRQEGGAYENTRLCSKLWCLPHLSAALVAAGNPGIMLEAVEALMLRIDADDVSDAGAPLGEYVAAAVEQLEGANLHFGDHDHVTRNAQIIMAGYSPRDRQCVGFIFDTISRTWGKRFERGPVGSGKNDFMGEFAQSVPTVGEALRLMQRQYDEVDPEWRSCGVGGPVTTAEISATGIFVDKHPGVDQQRQPADGMTRQQRRRLERQQRKEATHV